MTPSQTIEARPAISTTVPNLTHELPAGGDALALRGREWVLTNGAGGYAMGTAAAINTRRYHGLLVAATHPPVGRIVALNGVLEQLSPVEGNDQVLEFNSAAFHADLNPSGGDAIVPDGYRLLERFERGLSVAWEYEHGRLKFERQLVLHWKRQAATIRYTIRGGREGDVFRLGPMMTLRDFHALLFKDQLGRFDLAERGQWIAVTRAGVTVTVNCPGGRFMREDSWWYGFHYEIETRRGQEDREDQFLPGAFEFELDGRPEQSFTLTVALGDRPVEPVTDCDARRAHLEAVERRLAGVLEGVVAKQESAPKTTASGRGRGGSGSFLSELRESERSRRLVRTLAIASDDFVVDRVVKGEKLSTILAGYPWFADWGRDTFISLEGLLLATGRYDEARRVLRAFASSLRDGLVPNRFDDYDDKPESAHYNTVDASLWFIHAAIRYLQVTGDRQAWEEFLSAACQSIIRAHIEGTKTIGHAENAEIRMGGDGLIAAGSPRTQLTWMDAACHDPAGRGFRVFTPRHGKAVEINALWYNALAGMAEVLAESDAPAAEHYTKLTKRIKRSFAKVFWNDQTDCLFDHVWYDDQGDAHPDGSIRPNQIFAVSLPHSPLPRNRQKKVIDVVREKLLTPFGLRTLPEGDPNYHARYGGPQFQRDKAYHQGTIWPWLIGPYCEAVLRQSRFGVKAVKEVQKALTPLVYELLGETDSPTASIGQLHEIHEAASPHAPVGCMAQAWSVAEVVRVLWLVGRGE